MALDSRTQAGGALRTALRHRRIIGLGLRPLAVVAALALVTGFGQAALLLVVVRGATALTADTTLISGTVGPFTVTDMTTRQVLWLGVIVLVILLFAEVALSWAQASMHATAQRSSRNRLLSSYAQASYPEQVALPRGEMQQLLVGHSSQSAALAGQISSLLVASLNFLALVVSAFVLSPMAAVVVVGGLLLMLGLLRPMLHLIRRVADRRANAQRVFGATVAERLELAREIRAFAVDEEATEPARRAVDVVADTMRKTRFFTRVNSALYRLGAFTMVLVTLLAIESSGAQNLAALTGALLMLLRSLGYGQATQSAYQVINETTPVVEHLASEDARLRSGSAGLDLAKPPQLGSIRFDGVSFAYTGGDQVLHDVSFELPSGEFTAIVGPSGAGKSTIVALLLRLQAPTGGQILADGRPVEDVAPAWWHQRVAFVPQQPHLSSVTAREAIRFFRPWVTDEAVERAARMAHIDDEIRALPDGYDTPVGQLGDAVSGGQRQRLAIARALAGDPEILVLDEPTSALDPVSEELVSQTLADLSREITIVVVAHRLKTIEHASRILRVESGQVVHQVQSAEVRPTPDLGL